jgi:hypothetical protein
MKLVLEIRQAADRHNRPYHRATANDLLDTEAHERFQAFHTSHVARKVGRHRRTKQVGANNARIVRNRLSDGENPEAASCTFETQMGG